MFMRKVTCGRMIDFLGPTGLCGSVVLCRQLVTGLLCYF
uniref:Bm1225 n=1 Tax=Brugia malayi TaxID=6279 RepID=A0A1I9G0X5_BRUMA|nr:Bm1225 [Brugia malayi]